MSSDQTQQTQQIVTDFAQGHDAKYLAPDATFTLMGTGDTWQGRDTIQRSLDWLYHQAFTAQAEVNDVVVGDGKAAAELVFRGRHTGEFFGFGATGREVNVPFCVVYQLANGLITRGDLYLELSNLVHQISGGPRSATAPMWPGD